MNKLIGFTVLLFCLFTNTNESQININKEISKSNNLTNENSITINDKEYDLHIEIESDANEQPTLVIRMELKNDSYFISPHEKQDFTGKFFVDLGDYKNIEFDGEIKELPKSIETYGPNQHDGKVRTIRVNTTYKQPLMLKSIQDFNTFGRIKFTIEPRCTLEIIPFAIKSKNGVFSISKPTC